jgi:plastocyanin
MAATDLRVRDMRSSSLLAAAPESADTAEYGHGLARFDPIFARAVGFLTVGALLAACGGSPAREPAATATARPAVVAVEMRGIRFRPHRIAVTLGQSVRWTNHDAVAHTVASQALRVASDAIGPGQAFSYRPRRRGTFAYYCTIHAGQTGELVVR